MRSNARWLTVLATLFAACAALPVLAIVTRGLAPGTGATWTHLANTVLPGYVANTLALVVLVALGAAVGGTVSGWLIARRRFPGSGFLEWALMLPLAMPSYVMAYAYTDFLQYAGPLQTALRAMFGWSRQDYWFPDVRSLGGAATMFVFALYPYVYLLARTAFIERPPALMEAARTLGLDRRQAFWRVELAAGASGHCRRHRAGPDGDAGRLRNGRVLRRRHVHHGHLPRVVLARRSRGRRATGHGTARLRDRSRSPWNVRHAARGARPAVRAASRRRASRRPG